MKLRSRHSECDANLNSTAAPACEIRNNKNPDTCMSLHVVLRAAAQSIACQAGDENGKKELSVEVVTFACLRSRQYRAPCICRYTLYMDIKDILSESSWIRSRAHFIGTPNALLLNVRTVFKPHLHVPHQATGCDASRSHDRYLLRTTCHESLDDSIGCQHLSIWSLQWKWDSL
jgi:hypothetical protein